MEGRIPGALPPPSGLWRGGRPPPNSMTALNRPHRVETAESAGCHLRLVSSSHKAVDATLETDELHERVSVVMPSSPASPSSSTPVCTHRRLIVEMASAAPTLVRMASMASLAKLGTPGTWGRS